MTVVLVCGSHTSADREFIYRSLDNLHDTYVFSKLIHGKAPYTDTIAGEWAKARGIEVEEYPADWTLHGKAAGPIRNAEMLAFGKPDLVVAFSGNRGTADMVAKAQRKGVDVEDLRGKP